MLFFSTVGDGGVRTTLTHGPETARAQRKNEIPFTLQEVKGRNLNLSKGETEVLFQKWGPAIGSTVFLSENCILMVHKQFIRPQVMICDWFSKALVVSCYNVVDFLPSPLAKRSSGANGILGMKRKEAGRMFRGHHEADVTHRCPVHLRCTQHS